jgi:uncharacterized iron-regulated membrane protein
MIRALHRWPGLLAAALLIVLTLSGAALAVFPATERLQAPQAQAGLSVADLAGRIQANYPQVEQVRRAASGQITAYWFAGGAAGAAVIDPVTGQGVGAADPNQTARWLTNLHRSLFLGDGGRIVVAIGAAAMLILAISGAVLVMRRAGGLRRWFAPMRGPLSGRLHVEIARVAVLGLALSAITGLWMSAATFDLLPDTAGVQTGDHPADRMELQPHRFNMRDAFFVGFGLELAQHLGVKRGQIIACDRLARGDCDLIAAGHAQHTAAERAKMVLLFAAPANDRHGQRGQKTRMARPYAKTAAWVLGAQGGDVGVNDNAQRGDDA